MTVRKSFIECVAETLFVENPVAEGSLLAALKDLGSEVEVIESDSEKGVFILREPKELAPWEVM